MKFFHPFKSRGFDISLFMSVIFVLFISLPLVYKGLGGKNIYLNTENRNLAQLPAFSWNPVEMVKLPERFQYYFNDNFGLRDALIRWRHQFMMQVLNTSPLPNRIILGKEGWMYAFEKNDYENFLGVTAVTEQKLAELQDEVHQKLQPEKFQNIQFYFVIAPDKETIYPEYLPCDVTGLDTKVRLRDFLQRAQFEGEVKMVNVLDPLLVAKDQGKLYYQTDSHWNPVGAFFADQEIIRQVRVDFPVMECHSLSDYKQVSVITSGRDLSTFLGFPEIEETEVVLHPIISSNIKKNDVYFGGREFKSNHEDGPVMLLIGDSFSDYMPLYLAEQCSKVIQVKNATNFGPIIEAVQPDIVVYEIVERYFFTPDERPLWKEWMKEWLGRLND